MLKIIAAAALIAISAYFALYGIAPDTRTVAAETAEQYDENGLLTPSVANTDRTTPESPYEHPTMSLIKQLTRSSNSLASQEVNRNLNNAFANYVEPYTGVAALVTSLLATVALAFKAVWLGIPFASALSTVMRRAFFRWPKTPLEWINKLAVYIGFADVAWMALT